MDPAPTCPVCGQPLPGALEECPHFPFCSKKCRTIDLGRWLTEDYGIPAEEIDEEAQGEEPG